MKNILDLSLFMKQGISGKKEIAFSEFVVLAVNWAITVTNNQQRVCKIMFLIRTFVKTNSNLMCGSF